ncbi:MAG: putative Fe-S protein YdhL (DUF1289 family) [Oleispira sp.]
MIVTEIIEGTFIVDDHKKPLFNEKAEPAVIKSPCVHICCLDEKDICLGCYRSCDEICKWGAMDNEQRKDVMKKVAEREQESGNMMKF